jgi:hypothetical protein
MSDWETVNRRALQSSKYPNIQYSRNTKNLKGASTLKQNAMYIMPTTKTQQTPTQIRIEQPLEAIKVHDIHQISSDIWKNMFAFWTRNESNQVDLECVGVGGTRSEVGKTFGRKKR